MTIKRPKKVIFNNGLMVSRLSLGALYAAQGLVFGFSSKGLVPIMRARGLSFGSIGLLGQYQQRAGITHTLTCAKGC